MGACFSEGLFWSEVTLQYNQALPPFPLKIKPNRRLHSYGSTLAAMRIVVYYSVSASKNGTFFCKLRVSDLYVYLYVLFACVFDRVDRGSGFKEKQRGVKEMCYTESV